MAGKAETGDGMKRKTAIISGLAVFAILLTASVWKINTERKPNGISVTVIGGADGPTSVFLAGKIDGGDEKMAGYTSITMDEAKKVFQTAGDYQIVDVRRADEFAVGHIPGAMNIANEEIGSEAPAALPDKNQVIYVYCRSGSRSKQAAAKLAALGYTHIIEIGGIMNWTGEVER